MKRAFVWFRGRPRRVKVLTSSVAAVLVAVIAVPVGLSLGSADAPTASPLGEGATASLLDSPAASGVPADYAEAVAGHEEIAVAQASQAASREGVDFFTAPSSSGRNRFCAFAARRAPEGVYSSYICAPRASLGSGLTLLQLQTRPGGLEAPRVYFGIAPDGIAKVVAGSETATVRGNVFSFSRLDGKPLSPLTFVRSDGTSVSVETAG